MSGNQLMSLLAKILYNLNIFVCLNVCVCVWDGGSLNDPDIYVVIICRAYACIPGSDDVDDDEEDIFWMSKLVEERKPSKHFFHFES